MKKNPIKSWVDKSVIDRSISTSVSTQPNTIYAYNKPDNLNQRANIQLLDDMLMSGFKPKWYCVIHFNDGGNSKREQNRRLNDSDIEDDLWVVKNFIYTELYGKNWLKQKHTARSIWGIEYGRSKIKPHVNIVIEELPYPYNDFKSLFVLLDRYLPDRVKCLWRRSAHVQPVFLNEGITSYITKECDYRNSHIIQSLTDYYIK
tara:strand:+ start:251 stop:859 length:609 start_codon:yes stop_codon:yes gene_type:complete